MDEYHEYAWTDQSGGLQGKRPASAVEVSREPSPKRRKEQPAASTGDPAALNTRLLV